MSRVVLLVGTTNIEDLLAGSAFLSGNTDAPLEFVTFCVLNVQDILDGADDGPGVMAPLLFPVSASAAAGGSGAVLGVLGSSIPFDPLLGFCHSLQELEASMGVKLLKPMFLRVDPKVRLDLNSCNCMMRFMLGPIHLLRLLMVSYASCTVISGRLYRQ